MRLLAIGTSYRARHLPGKVLEYFLRACPRSFNVLGIPFLDLDDDPRVVVEQEEVLIILTVDDTLAVAERLSVPVLNQIRNRVCAVT